MPPDMIRCHSTGTDTTRHDLMHSWFQVIKGVSSHPSRLGFEWRLRLVLCLPAQASYMAEVW